MKGSVLILVCAVIYFVDACNNNPTTTKKPVPSIDEALKAARGGAGIEVLTRYLDHHHPDSERSELGLTLLGTAALHGNLEAISLLLAKDADVNAQSSSGNSALAYAKNDATWDMLEQHDATLTNVSFDNAQETAKGKRTIKVLRTYLSQHHPDSERSSSGTTLLMYAAGFGSTEATTLLLAEGADVNAQDRNGQTALIWNTRFGGIDTMKILLANVDIDVNIQDKKERTALIWASRVSRKEKVKILLENANIDLNIQDKHGSTALGLATNDNVKNILKKFGAECRKNGNNC